MLDDAVPRPGRAIEGLREEVVRRTDALALDLVRHLNCAAVLVEREVFVEVSLPHTEQRKSGFTPVPASTKSGPPMNITSTAFAMRTG